MFKRPEEWADSPDTDEIPEAIRPAKANMEDDRDLDAGAAGESGAGPAWSSDRIAEELTGTVVGEDITIVGNLSCPGNIQVSGTVQGDVACRRLLADKTAHIIGGITADEVIVNCRVSGPIRAVRVTLQPQARVEGDITYESFAIEKGAEFEGSAHHSNDPKRNAIDAAVASMAGPSATVRSLPGPVKPAPSPAVRAARGRSFKRAS